MRGECKVPGGKLVQVELAVQDQQLRTVRIRGDFFLQPEARAKATLEAMGQALEGLPTDLPLGALQARLQAAIPLGVELLGTTPEAIAIAVQRAISGQAELHAPQPLERIGSLTPEEIQQHTQLWQSAEWELLPEQPLSAARNVALDEVLTNEVAQGRRGPTLRFWRWTEPAIIIGRTQSVANEVDWAAAQARGLQVVRRLTGGGAMFLQPHGAITYSLYLPERLLPGLTIRQSYEVCDAWTILALRDLGCQAYYVPINDIASTEGKIGGAAQARRQGVILHHTTMAYDLDPGEMLQVLRIGREKLKDKGTPSAQKRVSPLVRQTGASREAIVEHLFESFRRRYGGSVSSLRREELQQAQELAEVKYSATSWTHDFE